MSQAQEQRREKAIVIGASMAGLLAARVASEAFDEVVLIERDLLPTTIGQRKGVPQGRHAHALLAQGHEILEGLFPGLTESLSGLGAPIGFGRFFVGGGYLCRVANSPQVLFASRPALESEVRSRLLSLPNVRVLEQVSVAGLETTADRDRVTGVRVQHSRDGNADEILSANLVIDASGRGSRTPAWLEGLGFSRPPLELLDIRMGYVSRLYQRKPEHLAGDLIANIAPTRENTRACGMLAQEGDRWMVTLVGYFGDYPPTDEQGFLDFAKTLAVPDIHEVIRTATPLTDLVAYKFPSDQRYHYERLKRFPEGFLVFGDAICSITPIYGQGMTVAALEAIALRECLATHGPRLAQRFFPRASKIVDMAWAIAAGGDWSLFDDQAQVPRSVRLLNWYIGKLQIAARQEPVVSLSFLKAANLMAAPPSLLHPRIALRVLIANLRRRPA